MKGPGIWLNGHSTYPAYTKPQYHETKFYLAIVSVISPDFPCLTFLGPHSLQKLGTQGRGWSFLKT